MKPSRYVDDPSFTRKYDVRLALVLGDRAATFVQQVHYHARWKEEQFGMLEWRSSMSEWKVTFPHWSEDTIKRIVKDLKAVGVLKTRRGSFRGRDAVWFSLDYERIDELGDEGHEKYVAATKRDQRQTVVEDEADDQEVQIAPHTGGKMLPLGGAKCTSTGVQNAPHQIDLSNTAGSRKANSRCATAQLDRSPTTDRQQQMKDQIRQRHRATLEKRFEEKKSVRAVETWWDMYVGEHHGSKALTPFSSIDRRSTKVFMTWCKKADVNLLHFIEWCIANWATLRDHTMRWAKLSDTPTFRTVYSLKDRFLEQYRKKGGVAEEKGVVEKEVYTDISQVPKDHPQFKQIKILIETQGRAEAS